MAGGRDIKVVSHDDNLINIQEILYCFLLKHMVETLTQKIIMAKIYISLFSIIYLSILFYIKLIHIHDYFIVEFILYLSQKEINSSWVLFSFPYKRKN